MYREVFKLNSFPPPTINQFSGTG